MKPELFLQTHFTAFLVLWKLHKPHEALSYIHHCAHTITSLNRHCLTSFSRKTRLNLSGLIAISLAAALRRTEGGLGVDIVQKCLGQLAGLEVAVVPTMYRFLERLRTCTDPKNESLDSSVGISVGTVGTSDYSLQSLPSEKQETRESADLLVDKDYEKLFFIANFLPHIDASAPLIRESDLEVAEIRKISLFSQKSKQKGSRKVTSSQEVPQIDHENYLKLFQNIISRSKAQINADLERVSDSAKGVSKRFRPHLRSESERRPASTPFQGSSAYEKLPSSREIPANISLLQEIERKKATLQRSRHIVETLQAEARGRRTRETIMVELDMRVKGEVEVRPVQWGGKQHRKGEGSWTDIREV